MVGIPICTSTFCSAVKKLLPPGQGHYHPYYQRAPRGNSVDNLTQAFESTTVHDDPSHGHDGYNDQFVQYDDDNYYTSTVPDAGGLVPTDREGQSQAYIPTAPGYNQVPPSGNKKGDKGPRGTKKGSGEKNKGGKASSSKEQRSKGQQNQNAMYGGPDPFYPPAAENLVDTGAVEESPQDNIAYHGYNQASSSVPSDQQSMLPISFSRIRH